jgi:hypothetical protein
MERQVKKKIKWYQRALKSFFCRSSSFLSFFFLCLLGGPLESVSFLSGM